MAAVIAVQPLDVATTRAPQAITPARAAAVFGIPEEALGVRRMTYIVPMSEATFADLSAIQAENLAVLRRYGIRA